MRNYLTYSNDDILNGVKQVKSMAGLLKFLGLKPVGGNYANMKRKLQQIGANCEHWTGQAWNRDERLKDWSSYTKASNLKEHLIKERGHKCQTCQRTEWNEKPIPLEVHHIDGDRTNNSYSNLELDCANCHYQTKGFRNRLHQPKTKKERRQREKQLAHDLCGCGNSKRKKSKKCINCSNKSKEFDKISCYQPKINWPDKNKLHWLVWNCPMTDLAKILGVSDNAIRQKCKKYLIIGPKLGFWQKYRAGLIVDFQI